MKRSTFLSLPFVLLAACTEPSSPPQTSASDEQLRFAQAVADPTATVKLPIVDAGLSLKSDGQFSDGTYSAYANGVCGITATIFLSGSGDMVMDGGDPRYADKKCSSYPRKMTVLYPDGLSETIPGAEVDLQALESSSFAIPVGSTALRHFHVRTSTTRCDGVHWGFIGGDSVQVTRTAGNTWHVQTQPYPNDQAMCKNSSGNYLLGHMPVDVWIVSSRTLP